MEYVEHLIVLAVDGIVFAYCFKQYYKNKTLANNFAEAQSCGINPSFSSIRTNPGAKFAVVRGTVKAIGQSIKSINASSVTGVIQKLTVKEHSLARNSPGYWNNQERIIDEKVNEVPFQLRNGRYAVTIGIPLEAEELLLDVVEDRFVPSLSNFVGHVIGFLVGLQQKGLQYTEYLLKEDSLLTGFGEITINSSGEIQLQPPSDGSPYILTPLEPSLFIRKIRENVQFYKYIVAVCSGVGVIATILTVRKWWSIRKKKEEENALQRRVQEARILHQQNIATGDPGTVDFLTCLVCFTNPREIILLPCGHVCLCSYCIRSIVDQICPICRQQYQQTNLAFIS